MDSTSHSPPHRPPGIHKAEMIFITSAVKRQVFSLHSPFLTFTSCVWVPVLHPDRVSPLYYFLLLNIAASLWQSAPTRSEDLLSWHLATINSTVVRRGRFSSNVQTGAEKQDPPLPDSPGARMEVCDGTEPQPGEGRKKTTTTEGDRYRLTITHVLARGNGQSYCISSLDGSLEVVKRESY